MPTLEKNLDQWSRYSWPEGGDEWSAAWGGTPYLWWGTIYPRVLRFLPCDRILEIAPGFGRCTQFLKGFCRELMVVDMTERCIEACRRRFAEEAHIEYFVNDGRSLAMIADVSADFVFSWDSLVHVEADVIRSYVAEIARVLRRDGVAFIHHSNLGAIIPESERGTGEPGVHWRAKSMSAALLEEFCEEAGLRCIAQEIVNWGGPELIDCISLLTPAGSKHARPNLRRENPDFMLEALGLWRIAAHYARVEGDPGQDPWGLSQGSTERGFFRRLLDRLG